MDDQLRDFFNKHRSEFDLDEPRSGHFDRFENRLARSKGLNIRSNYFKGLMLAIAASVVLVFGYWLGSYNHQNQTGYELADVSPRMEETQHFYMTAIQKEIEQINGMRNDSNKKIIDDAFYQLELLEKNYEQLTVELKESNADKRVVYAMIRNFQTRTEVLSQLIEQLDQFEQMTSHENKV